MPILFAIFLDLLIFYAATKLRINEDAWVFILTALILINGGAMTWAIL
jgi:hypothetical protein